MKIEFQNISKQFGEIKANDDISFTIDSGTIHAIIGENGAGKSTLIKILSGQLLPDNGTISINNNPIALGSTLHATEQGIGILGQDPLDFSNFTVLESFIAGSHNNQIFLSKPKIEQTIELYSKQFNWDIKPNSLIKDLSIGERQQLELIRLLEKGTKIIILDEPTSGFSLEQKEKVFNTLRTLASDGYSIILVSHKIEEILEICSKATIMQNGKATQTVSLPIDPNELVNLMFGEQSYIQNSFNLYSENSQNITIEVTKNNQLKTTENLQLNQNLIVGIAGLQGSGADSFIQSFITKTNYSTKILTETNSHINQNAITYVPADRLEKGLFSDMNIMQHVALIHDTNGVINWPNIRKISENLIEEYGIRGTPNSLAQNLSGGNQQRLMLSLIPKETQVLLLEQPTRGLDIQSARYIWSNLIESREEKVITIFSSVDLDEIYNYANYIICFYNDDIVAHGTQKELPRELTMQKISGR
ncbi:MAG: hypothetical protein CMP22_05660 [Rickettsiales bacterium]|nr:hypothetical protein [Rickettsiales bacterium]|tara:strand:- start:271 stop:1698 length:1428 start_codon:yes stop_codon:yes gene_type:complete